MTKQRKAGAPAWFLLSLLCLGIAVYVLFVLIPGRFTEYLMPLTNLWLFFANWFNPLPVIAVLLLLPLAGWLLLWFGIRFGRYLVLYPHILCIIFQFVILLLHLATMLKLYRIDAFHQEALRCLIGTLYSVLVITFLLKWYPSNNTR